MRRNFILKRKGETIYVRGVYYVFTDLMGNVGVCWTNGMYERFHKITTYYEVDEVVVKS